MTLKTPKWYFCMEPVLTFNQTVGIVGTGPAGITAAIFLLMRGFPVTLFDKGKFLGTILATGGGRCNLAFAEYDFKSLAKNYPRGEKFLYSLFSRFSTKDTIKFMNSAGIKTYTQSDLRIFPVSNSAAEVREKLLKSANHCSFIKEEVLGIYRLENCYKVETNKSDYAFDILVIATGGHSGTKILSNLGLEIIPQTPSLTGLVTNEDFSEIAGVSIKNAKVKYQKRYLTGDILFTHKGVSGPLVYKISSLRAKDSFPYGLNFKFSDEFDLQELLDKNPHKEIKNLPAENLPKSFFAYLLNTLKIQPETQCHQINGKTRNLIYEKLTNFEVTVTGKVPDGEIVTCGGVSLNEINSKTMEAKRFKNLYFCGEILDVDGFCGGFNLQNCWTTGYAAAEGIYLSAAKYPRKP